MFYARGLIGQTFSKNTVGVYINYCIVSESISFVSSGAMVLFWSFAKKTHHTIEGY
jgi:hypothetical protein